jgi:predicted ester cyclase
MARRRPSEEITMTDTTFAPTADQTADIKAVARRTLEEIFPANDAAAIAETTDADFINHEAPPGTPPGPGSVIYFMQMLADAFSDQHWAVEQVISDGDLVAVRCTHSGRHTGKFLGLPATGRTFSYQQMHMLRFKNGKATEHWAVRDDASLMRQLTGSPQVRS